MFSLSGLLVTKKSRKPQRSFQPRRGSKKTKKKSQAPLTACVGTAIRFSERYNDVQQQNPNLYGYACSIRCCRHPIHIKDRSRSFSRGKSDEFISEDIYKRYTETDSRPLSPDLNRRSISVPRRLSISGDLRKCVTPEPEARQCQFHHKRVLILDLRRVKSVDAIAHQGSRTPGTSIDSTYGDDDADYHSSNLDSSSIFHHQLSPRNLSLSRSQTPKKKQKKGKSKAKERSTSPIVYERSTSPKILEGLTLPPLHSSVLTLLGQRSGVKPSPRNLINQTIQEHSVSSGASRQKKLRRHGPRRKKGESKPQINDESGQGDKSIRSASMNPLTEDEPHETQVSNYPADLNDSEEGQHGLVSEEKLEASLFNLVESRRALYHVLDDFLGGKPWSARELTDLEEEISSLSNYFEKYQTKFKIEDIKMKQDTWLSFPRTWTRSSASFGVPYDIRSLKEMKSTEYLEKYVTISEPRKHLYDLVFQRYRTMENPTGTCIPLKTLKASLTEVIGHQFSDKDMDQLCDEYLGISDRETPIYRKLFNGICAFCERIYSHYSLEDQNECQTCYKTEGKKDKLRCHQNQKSLLERNDLSFLSAKIRDGYVQNNLSSLIQALCERD